MMDRKRAAYAIATAIFVLLGLAFAQMPTKLAYAHTFSGNESSAFIATISVLRTEIRLINNTVATNSSLANEHAKIAVGHLSANDTNELAERNQRIATDLPKDLSSLQNMTAKLSPTNTTGIAAVKQLVGSTDSLLSEALSVRVEPDQLKNATVYGTAVADLLNETLERYSEATGIIKAANTTTTNSSSATTNTTPATAAGGNVSSIGSSNNATNMTSSSNVAKIANFADYQSTQGLVNMTKEIFNQTKMLLSSNATNNATTTSTTNTTGTKANSSAIAKVDNDLNQLKALVDNKTSYSRVVTFVYSTIYLDLNSALNLGLSRVDANKAIQNAMSSAG